MPDSNQSQHLSDVRLYRGSSPSDLISQGWDVRSYSLAYLLDMVGASNNHQSLYDGVGYLIPNFGSQQNYSAYWRSFSYGNGRSIEFEVIGDLTRLGVFNIDQAISDILQQQDFINHYSDAAGSGSDPVQRVVILLSDTLPFAVNVDSVGSSLVHAYGADVVNQTGIGHWDANGIMRDAEGRRLSVISINPDDFKWAGWSQFTEAYEVDAFFTLVHELGHSINHDWWHTEWAVWDNRATFQPGQLREYLETNFTQYFGGYDELANLAVEVAIASNRYNSQQAEALRRMGVLADEAIERAGVEREAALRMFVNEHLATILQNPTDTETLRTLGQPGGVLDGLLILSRDSETGEYPNLLDGIDYGEIEQSFVWDIETIAVSPGNFRGRQRRMAPLITNVIDQIAYSTKLDQAQKRKLIHRVFKRAEMWAGLGNILGSQLGNFIIPSGGTAAVAASAFLGAFGANLARQIVYDSGVGGWNTGDIFGQALSDTLTPAGLANAFVGAGVGTVSSMLTLELADSLGLEGASGEIFSAATGGVVNRVVGNVLTSGFGSAFEGVSLDGFWDTPGFNETGTEVTGGLGAFAVTAIASYLGRKLGASIVSPETEAAVRLSSLGSAVGSWALSSIGPLAISQKSGWLLANAIAPGVGALVGFVLGALIGNIFGSKRPRIPTADAETVLNFDSGFFEVGDVTSQNGGNEALVRDMSDAARGVLNRFIGVVVGDVATAGNANYDSPTQVYGHTGDQLWVKLGSQSAAKNNFDSADEAVDHGVLWALRQTKIVGGDLFTKRIISRSLAASSAELAGEFQIADDYNRFLQNKLVILAAISAPYENLSPSDRDFYDLNIENFNRAATIDGIPEAQRESESWYQPFLSWRTSNFVEQGSVETQQARIDRILQEVQISQFASGWIVTLQRAEELGLNRTALSDFYGGFGGFVESLGGLIGGEIYNEDVMFGFDGNTMQVDYGRWNGRADDNLMRGGDLSLGTGLLQHLVEHGTGASHTVERIDGESAIVFRDTDFHTWSNGTLYGHHLELTGGDMDGGRSWKINGGDHVTIGFEAKQLGDTNNRLYMYVGFYDAAGAQVGWHALDNGYTADWDRRTLTVQAASNAVSARVFMYGYGRVNQGAAVGALDVAARNFQFNRAATPFESTPDYRAPVYERFNLDEFYADGGFAAMSNATLTTVSTAAHSQIHSALIALNNGYMGSFDVVSFSATGQDNTSGNDIHIHSGSNGITIDDYHYETFSVIYERQVAGGPFGEFETTGASYSGSYTAEGGDDIFVGGSGNDTLRGRSGYDWLSGGEGDDTIYGYSEDDVILGGDGDDALYGGTGDDYIAGGAGNDWMRGESGNDTIILNHGGGAALGEAGDDTFIVGDDQYGYYGWARGGYGAEDAGNDTLSFERVSRGISLDMNHRPTSWDSSSDPVYAHAMTRRFRVYDYVNGAAVTSAMLDINVSQIDNVTGTEFADQITGDGSANILRGLGGDDSLHGGYGNDTLEGGAGADKLYASAGNDTASYKHSRSAVWVDMGSQEYFGGDAEGDELFNVENLRGSDFDDTFFGDGGANILYGGRGDDWFVATAGSDSHHGDEDFDTVDYADMTSSITVNLASNSGSGAASGHTFYGIEHIVGTDYADSITMDDKDNYLQGGKGNDTLNGGAGLDTYIYNRGDGYDTIVEVETGGGFDTLVLADGLSWSDLTITTPNASLDIRVRDTGNADRIWVQDNFTEWQNPGAKIDAIDVGGVGTVDIDHLTWAAAGGDNADTLYGRNDKHDILMGYAGNDVLYAAGSASGYETNHNVLWAGRGDDTLYASTGDDQYIFDRGDGVDTIYDTGGYDRIQFGPDVYADDVIYEVVGSDLVIGLRDADNPDLTASQVTDRIIIKNGGSHSGAASRVEYITAGGVDIDINKLGIEWSGGAGGGGTGGGGTGGGGTGGGGGGEDPVFPPGDFNLPPVVFDLDGDGLDLVSVNQSRIVYDSGNGPLLRMGWVGADDGFLALDRDGDGIINKRTEISFVGDFEGATTDLEGLKGFDSNEDGVLNADDEMWSEFRIWQDVNQNGVGTASELVSLEEAGVAELSLSLTTTGRDTADMADSTHLNTAVVTMADGSTMTAHDVALRMILARAEGSGLPGADLWENFDLSTDGTFGVAHTGEDFDAVNIAQLLSKWDIAEAGPEGAGWTQLFQHIDFDDLLAAPEIVADPDDPQTETFGVKPIVIDMDGDGIELIDPGQSSIELDADGDGALDRMGWVSPDDGMLALDRNGDGVIEATAEISFVQDLEGAQTDLEGLRAYDSNADGWLDASDARFGDFKIWVDRDYSGTSNESELIRLDEAGLERLSLHAMEGTGSAPGALSNTIFGEAEIIWAEGASGGNAGDVELRAYTGNLQEQLYDRLLRQFAEQRATGPWAFGRDARRSQMSEMRTETGTPEITESADLPLGAFQHARAAGNARTEARSRLGANRVSSGEQAADQVLALNHGDLVVPGVDQRGVSRSESAGRLPDAMTRWWLAGDQSRGVSGVMGSLADRLSALDASREGIAPNGGVGSLPNADPDSLAERQRFLQAMAAFHGSSGVATLRKTDELTRGGGDVFANRSELPSGADAYRNSLYG